MAKVVVVLASELPAAEAANDAHVGQAHLVMTNTTGHSGAPASRPLPTVTTGGHHALTAATLAKLRGTSPGHMSGHSLDEPLSTISAGGTHHALAAAHITKFRTGSSGASLGEPMPTVTANSRVAGWAANQRATNRWVAFPGQELVYPATNVAGFALRAKSPGYTGTAVADAIIANC